VTALVTDGRPATRCHIDMHDGGDIAEGDWLANAATGRLWLVVRAWRRNTVDRTRNVWNLERVRLDCDVDAKPDDARLIWIEWNRR
jgi:hypothetical protein